jgi:hypothetical protein
MHTLTGNDAATLTLNDRQQAGETRIPLYVMDAGYDEAPLTWELREDLDQVQILVRVRNDRVMYRDPAPEPRRAGRPRRHDQDRFECDDPGTWGEPGQVLIRDDDRYGLMTVMSWGGLHPKLACRGHFETMARPPERRIHLRLQLRVVMLTPGQAFHQRARCAGDPAHRVLQLCILAHRQPDSQHGDL